ncbi:MAG: HEAT repeat domain-containing protein [Candidatus Lokiarchaeia archaeon]
MEPLIQAIKDENCVFRRGAILALGKIGDERAVGSLTQALKDENWGTAVFDITQQRLLERWENK